jgi:hypothetical protein
MAAFESGLNLNLLFFTPHAALWPHTAPEAYLARSLSECGHEVSYLTCGKAQTYCAPMTAMRLTPGCTPQESARICADCMTGANAIAAAYSLPMDNLAHYLGDLDFAKFEAMAAEAVVKKSLDTEYLGINVGRLALYEFTLAHKKMSTELTELQWKDYLVYLANALRTLQGIARYLADSRPDVILTFSPQYSNINSAMQYAISQGIRVLFMESGTNLAHRLGTMRVWDWNIHKLVNPALTYWGRSELNPVSASSAAKVTGHFEQLLSGKHFSVFSAPYSGAVGVRQRWRVKAEQKILLMTLSSYDEAYAALLIGAFPYAKVYSDVFRTQAEWVKATLDWVTTRTDLFVVIRVHPRDFPNKREVVRSEQSFMLEELLAHVPNNAHVNWPIEGVSLYEILEDTDAILTGWSVTAMEALVLGIPVVTYDANLPSYPKDVHYTGRSEAEYFSNIDRALSEGWRIDNAVNGFRWLAYNFVACTVTVSEEFGRFEIGSGSRFNRFLRRGWRYAKNQIPKLGFALDLRRWRDAMPGASTISTMLERGCDALPPARKLADHFVTPDDKHIVMESLSHLHELLYADSNLAGDKPGLSRNIRACLASESLR